MAYIKNVWGTGTKITMERMNHLEEGVESLSIALEELMRQMKNLPLTLSLSGCKEPQNDPVPDAIDVSGGSEQKEYKGCIYPQLRYMMYLRGLSYKELAQQMQISCSALRRKSRGEAEFTLSESMRIKEELQCGMSLEALFKKRE